MDRVEFFQDLGFGKYESKVIASLIKLGNGDVKEISLDSGVPRNKLYRILRKFEDEGLLEIMPGELKKYKLINIKGFVNKKLKEKEHKLQELKSNSKNIEIIQDKEEQFVFSLIKGQKAIMNKLVEINASVEKEILGVQRNWKYWGSGIREMEKAVKRGVKVKFIGVVDSKNMNKVKEWKKIGCKIRDYNKKFGEYPLRFSVFDGKYARITLGKPEVKEGKDYITILTDSKPLVNMLRNQFLGMWAESEKV